MDWEHSEEGERLDNSQIAVAVRLGQLSSEVADLCVRLQRLFVDIDGDHHDLHVAVESLQSCVDRRTTLLEDSEKARLGRIDPGEEPPVEDHPQESYGSFEPRADVTIIAGGLTVVAWLVLAALAGVVGNATHEAVKEAIRRHLLGKRPADIEESNQRHRDLRLIAIFAVRARFVELGWGRLSDTEPSEFRQHQPFGDPRKGHHFVMTFAGRTPVEAKVFIAADVIESTGVEVVLHRPID